MEFDLDKIREYAGMKFSPVKICRLLQLNRRQMAEFISRWEDPDDEIRICYEEGMVQGEYDRDQNLIQQANDGDVDAVTELGTRQYHRQQDDLKKELFGL
ncbi:MAG: hypothetical protein V2B15_08635 [Bacteroidota bacterium]